MTPADGGGADGGGAVDGPVEGESLGDNEGGDGDVGADEGGGGAGGVDEVGVETGAKMGAGAGADPVISSKPAHMTQNDKISASIIHHTWKSPSFRKQNVSQMSSPNKFEKNLSQAQLQGSSQSRMILSNAQQFS
jgi:hypothetical protein